MKTVEKFAFIACPWIFGVVCTVTGLIIVGRAETRLAGIIVICTAFICMSLFGVSSILAKILRAVEQKNGK